MTGTKNFVKHYEVHNVCTAKTLCSGLSEKIMRTGRQNADLKGGSPLLFYNNLLFGIVDEGAVRPERVIRKVTSRGCSNKCCCGTQWAAPSKRRSQFIKELYDNM